MKLRSAAKVLIRRKVDGKYLILTSSKWEENPLRSQKPDLPGGVVEPGEGSETGLQRELIEEIGVSVEETDLQPVFAGTYVDDTKGVSTTFLLYSAEVDDLDIVLSWEHESFAWLSAEEVMSLEMRDPYPKIFAHCKKVGVLV